MEFSAESDIARAPDEVFDRMADARNEPSWNTQVSKSDLVSGAEVGPGAKFITVNRGKPYDATITTYDRPGRVVFEVTGKPLDITASFTITPRGEGAAHVESRFDFRPKGSMKLMFPLMQSAIRKDIAKQSESFKRFCEAG
ncbi:MAG TPA: SRPBCC family protein [Gaiellales bacterium]|nr:SRPBCC family protein [Gaiellales bacterium]